MFEAAQAPQAIECAGTAEGELGSLWGLSAVSADEKELLGEETKRLGEYEGLAGDSEFLECKIFATVPGVLV